MTECNNPLTFPPLRARLQSYQRETHMEILDLATLALLDALEADLDTDLDFDADEILDEEV